MVEFYERLKKIWYCVDGFPAWIKNALIVVLIMAAPFVASRITTSEVASNRRTAESYAMENSLLIQSYMNEILCSGNGIKSVMLLSYHNSTESLHGYQYLYVSSFTCAPVNDELLDDWDKVKFTPYSKELQYVHRHKMRTVVESPCTDRNVEALSRKLASQGMERNVLYTINGLKNPIGILVVTFEGQVNFRSEYVIFDKISRLAIILDYENNECK